MILSSQSPLHIPEDLGSDEFQVFVYVVVS